MVAFWRHGYEATSLADLTATMGITAPSLYAAFGDKDALFLEAVDRYQATHGAFAARALAEEPTARRAVERMLRDAARAYSDPSLPRGCLVIAGATNCRERSAAIEADLRSRRAANQRALSDRIALGRDAGELPPEADVEDLSRFYAAVLQGMSTQARDGATRQQLEAIASAAMGTWPRP